MTLEKYFSFACLAAAPPQPSPPAKSAGGEGDASSRFYKTLFYLALNPKAGTTHLFTR